MRQQAGITVGLLLGVIIVMGGIPGVGEAQTTTRVSVATGGGQANGTSSSPVVSDDGRIILFTSDATNLVPGDTNGATDVFVHDRQTRTTTRVNVSTGGAQANGDSGEGIALSGNGQVVAFDSNASNLVVGDTNADQDVFVHDRQTGITERVSVATGGGQGNFGGSFPALSGNGRFVAFVSVASNLVPGDTNFRQDVFVHDRQTGTTTRVNVGQGGIQTNQGSGDELSISGDGRFVAFISEANNLVPGDTNGVEDVFVHDRQTGTTTRVSVGPGGLQANGESDDGPALSADGRFVAFISDANNLVSSDTNGVPDIFMHDRQMGTTTRVSVATGGGGQQANAESESMALSGDGRFVAIDTEATNLVPNAPTHGGSDVYVHDRQTGITTLVSVATNGTLGNNGSETVKLSANGRFIVFESHATNLVSGDTNGVQDVFIHDRGLLAVGSQGGADFDGDGKADFIWRNTSSGVVAVWLMNGVAIASTGFPGGVPLNWQIAAIGDVNGDGRADVIWRHAPTGAVALWLMNGTTVTATGFPGGAPVAWALAGTGDLNGDGNADLVWRHTNSGAVAVWLMNGTQIAGTGFPSGVPLAWHLAHVGDVNGDGKADVIWRHGSSGTVAVWLMNGLTVTSVGFSGSAPTEWVIAELGDVDGNGTADVIWRHTNSGAVVVWLLNGTTMAASGFFAGKALEWAIAQVGDVNGDGKADIIWRNTSTGVVEVWLMNGLTIASTGSPGATSTDWEIQ
jgi:Tol biopolymer transport system component